MELVLEENEEISVEECMKELQGFESGCKVASGGSCNQDFASSSTTGVRTTGVSITTQSKSGSNSDSNANSSTTHNASFLMVSPFMCESTRSLIGLYYIMISYSIDLSIRL